MGKWSGAAGVAILVALACGEPEAMNDAQATNGTTPSLDLENTPLESPQVVVDPDDPFGVFGLETPANAAGATSRITAVWLINTSLQSLVVSGHGGARSVVLDTIGAADSVFVRIETRATSVVLEAVGAGSLPLGAVTVPMDSEPKRVAFPQ